MSCALATDPHEVGFDDSPDTVAAELAQTLGCVLLDYDDLAAVPNVTISLAALQSALTAGVVTLDDVQVFAGTLTVHGHFDGPDSETWRVIATAPVSSNPSLSVRS